MFTIGYAIYTGSNDEVKAAAKPIKLGASEASVTSVCMCCSIVTKSKKQKVCLINFFILLILYIYSNIFNHSVYNYKIFWQSIPC